MRLFPDTAPEDRPATRSPEGRRSHRRAPGAAPPGSVPTARPHPFRRLLVVAALLAAGAIPLPAGAAEQPPAPELPPPAPADRDAPEPRPSLPPGFDAFAPPVAVADPPAGAPVVAEWTRSAGPDDSLVLTGDVFSAFAGEPAGSDSRFLVFTQSTDTDAGLQPAAIQRLDSSAAAVTLPPTLPAGAMALLWPGNDAGWGRPVAVNRTEVWWIGPEAATRGETVSVFGRNLAHRPDGDESWIYLAPTGEAGRWLPALAANPFKVDFAVPEDLPDGSYDVWVHNGHGGHLGWSGPLTLTVDAGPGWTGEIVDVTAFGATGDGVTDDEAAIQRAVDEAATRPGSTLFFPAGVYSVSRGFLPPSNVRWMGEGAGNTVLRVNEDFVIPPGYDVRRNSLIFAEAGTNIELRDLTLDADGNLNGYLKILVFTRGVSDLTFRDVALVADGNPFYSMVDVAGSERVVFERCRLVGPASFLGAARQIFIHDSDFFFTDDAEVPIHSWGGQEIAMTGSTAQDLDNSHGDTGGWGTGRWYNGNSLWGTQRHVYLGGNTTIDLGVRPDYWNQNSGEQFAWEGTVRYAEAPVADADAGSVRLVGYEPTGLELDAQAVVVDGRGLGQHRTVVGTDPGSGDLLIATPWKVVPDGSSRVVVARLPEKMVIHDNDFDGKRRVVTEPDHVGHVGVQLFEGGLNVEIVGNRFHEVRAAVVLWGWEVISGSNLPVHWAGVESNSLEIGRSGISIVGQAPNAGVRDLGIVVRRNRLEKIADAFLLSADPGGPNPRPWVVFDVLEHNEGTDLLTGVTQTGPPGSIRHVVVRRNRLERGAAPLAGSLATSFVAEGPPALRHNEWLGFETTYGGDPPGAILELPQRVVEVSVAAGADPVRRTLEVWNSGTAPLAWSGQVDAPWLGLVPDEGTVPDEASTGRPELVLDPAGLPPGIHRGSVRIEAPGASPGHTVTAILEVRDAGRADR